MRKLAWFSVGAAAACLLSVYAIPMPSVLPTLIAAAVAIALFLLHTPLARRLRPIALGLAAGLGWCVVFYTLFFTPLSAYCGETVPFCAYTVDYTRSQHGAYATAEATVGGRTVRTGFSLSEDYGFVPGERFEGTAVFSRTIDADETYDVTNDVYLTAKVKSVTAHSLTDSMPLSCRAARLAAAVRAKLAAIVPPDAFGILNALVTGDRSDLDYPTRNNMILSGIYHAVSLSGMHVAILMGAVWLLVGKRQKLAVLLGIPTLIAFCLMTGAKPSTVRAAVMQIVLLLAPLAHREYDSPTAIGAAVLMLLCENPWSVAHWGLQLSVTATLGIVLLYPKLYAVVRRIRMPKPVRGILSMLLVTLTANAFSLPLTFAYFGVVSLLAPIVNLLCLGAVTVLFVGGLLTALLPGGLGTILAWLLAWLCRWITLVTQAAASLPFCAVYHYTPMLMLWAAFVYELWLAALYLRPKLWQPLAVTAVTLLLALGITKLDSAPHTFAVLDVGQGQCVLYHDRDGTFVMDCGGKNESSGEEAARYLISHGVRCIDTMVLSHYDSDHIVGMAQLMRRMTIRDLYLPYRPTLPEPAQTICATAQAHGTTVHFVDAPTETPLAAVYPPLSQENENRGSLTALIDRDGCRVMVMGDLPKAEEEQLIRTYSLRPVDALVAGHHGSNTSTHYRLLMALAPSMVLYSAGENNMYHHPARRTLLRATAIGSENYCTVQNGTMELRW